MVSCKTTLWTCSSCFFYSREKTVLLTLFIVNLENLTRQNHFGQSQTPSEKSKLQ